MAISQNQRVLAHLKRYVGITTHTAYDKYGITRLSARIYDLKNMGYEITKVRREVKNRYGESCKVDEYRLVKR